VPVILQTVVDAEICAVLMSALQGCPVEDCGGSPSNIVVAVAAGLAQLHALPIKSCPFDESIEIRLARAQADICRGRIDPREFHERNLGLSLKQLFDRLLATAPSSEDIVVVHGDATFTNLLIDSTGTLGFIDCGHAGRADRYTDLALVAMEIEDRFGHEWVGPFFKAYGFDSHSPDQRKLRFYYDLYELF